MLDPRPQRYASLICSYNFYLTFTLWTPAPHYLYKFPLMLTSSSCVIFNQRKLLNALESLVALQWWTESNQAGGRRDRKRRHQAKQQTTTICWKEVRRGQEGRKLLVTGCEKSQSTPTNMRDNSWVARLETWSCHHLQKVFFPSWYLKLSSCSLTVNSLFSIVNYTPHRAMLQITYLKPAHGEF